MKASVLVKLAVFVAVAVVLGVAEVNTLTGPAVGSTHTYRAIFGGPDGVSGLHTGDPVRAAGVPVGKVTAEKLLDANHVEVTFTANHNQRLTGHTWAVVRYANLLGQRYLALTQSAAGGPPLPPGGTIPQARTKPALSLTALFNGFRPLFQGLSPQEINQLSAEIVAVLQGQGQGIDRLIQQTAHLTGNLAQRQDVFDQVVDSLSSLLTTVAQHDDSLAASVTALHRLSAALAADGPGILDSLDSVDSLMGSVSGLLGRVEDHNLPQDIAGLNSVTATLGTHTGTLQKLLDGFVTAFGDFSRVTQNGNWVNFYPCRVTVRIHGTPSVSAADAVASLTQFLGPTLGGLISSLGLGVSGLAALALPLPLKFPQGQVGSSPQHTAVCR